MAIDTETMQVIERCVARAVSNATSLKGAADEISKGVTQYVGARYVPLFADPLEWDKTKSYEPLTIVLYQGASYTSRQYVPVGVEIDNDSFWALTGNYNAQVEQYRQEVKSFDGRITANAQAIEKEMEDRAADVTAEKTRAENAEQTLQANIDAEKTRAENAEQTLQANINKKCTYVTPEQHGAIGDGISDDTSALQAAINTGKYVIGAGKYKCTSVIKIANSNQKIQLNEIISESSDYALSIMNGGFGQDIDINIIDSSNNGVIAETTSITGRHNVHIGVILAKNGIAFNFKGGDGGVLDCHMSGQVWTGTTSGLTVAPANSFIGNIIVYGIRFTASNENATQLTLDSSNGLITQFHFPACSVEPEQKTKNCNGILVNVVNNIEYTDGYFRATELTGKKGYILKIIGNITQQLSEGLHFTFDHITPSKIDVTGVVMSRYYALDAPICTINCNEIVFANQPQSTQMVIYGNKKHCSPTRNRYALSHGDYEWSYDTQIQTHIEFSENGTMNIPEWFNPDTDTLYVNPASHSITLKINEYGSEETIGTLTESSWVALKFYRDNTNKLYVRKTNA